MPSLCVEDVFVSGLAGIFKGASWISLVRGVFSLVFSVDDVDVCTVVDLGVIIITAHSLRSAWLI